MTTTINITLYPDERDFLVRFLSDTLPNAWLAELSEATTNTNGLIQGTLTSQLLEDVLQLLQHATTHHQQIWTRDSALEMVERLEPYSP